jgi:hypothetical protein
MKAENTKYEKVLKLLRDTKPELKHAEMLTEKIMMRLKEEKSKINIGVLILEFVFGWIYVGWVRRSMVAVTVCVALLFGYQQVLILKKINELSGQRIQNGSIFMTGGEKGNIEKLRLFIISGKKLTSQKASVPKEEIDEMIRSINKLQIRYKDIIDLIEDDPELKKYFEMRMKEIEKNRN